MKCAITALDPISKSATKVNVKLDLTERKIMYVALV